MRVNKGNYKAKEWQMFAISLPTSGLVRLLLRITYLIFH